MSLTIKPRVLGAPKNLTRRFEARYRAQRQGQALLLAVVVMLFVALISAGFLATVAGNLNQTARTSEKNQATEAAKAGMAYVNNRINSSAAGENWRPNMESPIPNPSDAAAYANYALPIAQIQGLVAREFSKFPRTPADSPDSPQFYAKVERIGYSRAERIALGQAASATDDPESARAGMLKVSVVGLGKDDPNVFHRMVAYRGGYQAAPIGRVAKAVSNFDFTSQKPQSALAVSAIANEVILKADSPRFPSEGNFWITITPPNFSTTRPIQRAFVTGVSPDGLTLTLSANVTADTQDYADCAVDIATPLGAPTPLDYNRDGTAADAVNLDSNLNTFFQSARINGSAYWQGSALIKNLQSVSAATAANTTTSTEYPRTVDASAVMGLDTGSTVTANTLVPDSNTNASFATSIISDGKNRIAGEVDPLRQTKTFSPPDLTSDANLARYRGLTRDSKPLLATNPIEASSYGYGQGIYINNIQDREKVETAAGVYREMTQPELIDLWTSTDTTKSEYRAPATTVAIPAANVDTASLEQKRLRGWVAPDEFKPRGVTIEVFDKAGVPTIGITRDALIDGLTSAIPSGSKAWTQPDGNPKSATAGVANPTDFYEEVPLNATNGVIFAEGNVRIKGNATLATKSLTVVSLGNIYIEGSLGLDNDNVNTTESTRKILLLARKNVVVNPTSVISRPENYTFTNGASAANGSLFDIPVFEAGGFERGDYVQVSTQPSPLLVTNVSATTLTVDKDPQLTAAGFVVQTAKDTIDATRKNPRIANFNAVLQRRLPTPVSATAVAQKIAFRHMAEKLKAADLTLTYTPPTGPGTPPTDVSLFVKSLATPAVAGTIATAEKKFFLTENGNPRDTDLFSGTTPFTKSLLALSTDVNSTGKPAGWDYSFAYTDPLLENVPSIALAGIGNVRPNAITTLPSTRTAWNQIVYPTPSPVASLYLATSVAARTYGTTDQSTIGPVANAIRGFGFNPDHLVNEDALTADVAFGGDDGTATVEQTVLPDSRDIVLPVSANAQNTFSFKLNPIAGLVDNTVPTAPNRIPAYNLYGMRLDSPNADGSGAGTILKIDAYVYAQTGSWIVIPGGYFDPNMKNVALDLNRNGNTADAGETTPAYRYARYNYGIEFKGAIAENHAVLINDAGTAKGLVKEWMDKWTYPTDAAATTWQPIKYQFDPAYVLGKLEADPTINPSAPAYATGPQAGFYMPVANDVLYQE